MQGSSTSTVEASSILTELNTARCNPEVYISKLQHRISYFSLEDPHIYHDPTIDIYRRTKEGKAAFEDAIRFLRGIRPNSHPPLRLSPGLSASCRDLVVDHGPKGLTGSELTDGTSAGVRLVKYGKWQHKVAENICYGPHTAEEVIINFLVDDGEPNRTQRKTVFDPDFKVVGIAFGPHEKYGHMCAVAFTNDYVEGGGSGSTGTSHGGQSHAPVHSNAELVEQARATPPQSTSRTLLEETADGSAFVVKTEPLKVPLKNITLDKRGGLLHLSWVQETLTGERVSSGMVNNVQYKMPFKFSANSVHATYNPHTTQVTIHINKPGSSGGQALGPNDEVSIGSFSLAPVPGSSNTKIGIDIDENLEAYQLKVTGSKFQEAVTVKLKGGQTVCVEAEHTLVEDTTEKVITSIQKLTLPLKVSPTDISVMLKSHENSALIQVLKPAAEDPAGQDIRIPIYESSQ
jgi:uncharacterized protein YkwD